MAVRVSKLIHDAVDETEASFLIELNRDFFEEVDIFFFLLLSLLVDFLLVASFLSNEEDDSIDDRREWNDSSIDDLFARHHFEADLVNQLWFPCVEVLLQIVFEIIHTQIRFIIA